MSAETMELAVTEPEMASEWTDSQLDMFLAGEKPSAIDRSKPQFSYNAQRLWRDRPDVARAAIKALAEPRELVPYRRIMRRLHISYHLLRQLEISSATDIKAEKKNLGDVMLNVTEAYADQALATVGSTKGKDAVLAAAIAGDKYLQFRGEATQKIEITHKVDPGEKIREARDAILSAFQGMKRVEAVEIDGKAEVGVRNAELLSDNAKLTDPAPRQESRAIAL